MSLVSKNETIMDASEIADASEIGALHTRIAKIKTAEIARQELTKVVRINKNKLRNPYKGS